MDTKKKKDMTRREFMKASTAAAATSAIGGSWLGMLSKAAWADKKTNSVIIGWGEEVSQFNPVLSVGWGTQELPQSCMFDTLWDPRPDGTLSPNLAVRVPTLQNGGVSDDGLTWKVELRKGVKWHDGAPFTAADVEFTWQLIVNPKVMAGHRTGFTKIKEFKVIDDQNIQFKLSQPFAPMLNVWTFARIVPKHVLSKVPDVNTCEWNSTGTFGTGPFQIAERVPGSHIIYKRNPNYHLDKPKLETVIHKYIVDQNVLYTQLRTGEIDVLGTPGIRRERYDDAKKLPDVDIMLTPRDSTFNLLMNCHRPVFQDKRVRQAIHMAIDKETIIKSVFYDTVKLGLSYMNPDNWWYNRNLKFPYDPKRASELLDSLGWKMGSGGVREKDGLKLAFDFNATAGVKDEEQTQLLVQKNLRDIGIQANIKNLPPAVLWGDYFLETQYDMIIIVNGPDIMSDPDFTDSMHSKRDMFKYHDGTPEMDALLEQGVRTVDRAKRKAIYDRFQELFLDECVYISICGITETLAKKKALKGYEINLYTKDPTRFVREWYWG